MAYFASEGFVLENVEESKVGSKRVADEQDLFVFLIEFQHEINRPDEEILGLLEFDLVPV